jgi:hypothetical protein
MFLKQEKCWEITATAMRKFMNRHVITIMMQYFQVYIMRAFPAVQKFSAVLAGVVEPQFTMLGHFLKQEPNHNT